MLQRNIYRLLKPSLGTGLKHARRLVASGVTGNHVGLKRSYIDESPSTYTPSSIALGLTPALYSSTYPPNNDLINERHFYQNTVLMDWFAKQPRPVSLRQLAFFGRRMTEEKIISSANFVRTELPTRLAHRIRDLQVLPYSVVSNNHLTFVYQMYYRAFNRFRKFPVITTAAQNDEFCKILSQLLTEHMIIIPHLVMGAIETGLNNTLPAGQIDDMMSKMLRSRISRRVIAEQHLSLTKSFRSGDGLEDKTSDFIGEVFLQCSAKETIDECYILATKLVKEYHKSSTLSGVPISTPSSLRLPELIIEGHTDTKFPYMKSHLDYIIGEIMRNNVEATVVQHYKNHPDPQNHQPPPIVVSIANTADDILIRFSDQGGGIPPEILPHLWSFSKGPRSRDRLKNFQHIPILAKVNENSNFGHSYKHNDEHATNPSINSEISNLCHESENVKLSTAYKQSQIGWLPDELSMSNQFLGLESPSHGSSEEPTINDSILSGSSPLGLSSLASFTTRQPNLKLGMGLPMSRVYADYWNGALDLHSLEGHGCDVFLRISRLGNKNEKLQLDKV
ncbi:hypothetical protein NADFUDRAFT_46557 [Nadsonia fulvescens var. elongata DSM 6958]|uniref:Protein-serine/threonine kinase n=1 Tax=Nadsonia fulvescens var. elongata DSM 6958 TaxID=857566 RepID=A0A1E3PKP9_9ASCO|nr:hypothetical protein NADFUDRAFT_46557 [Nadsonia fulvescens var. elongata DSM 6958]